MIKALLLILDPANTWDKVEKSPNTVLRVFLLYLLPVMVISLAVEGWCLREFGANRGVMSVRVPVSEDQALKYAVLQFGLGLLIAFGGAVLVQRIGLSFQRRHTYSEAFATVGYSLGPYFLARMLDGVPGIHTWVCWAIGAFLAIATLYRGIPRLMKPDPSNALGLYLLCSVLLLILAGVAHFVATLVLDEKLWTTPLPI